MKNLDIDALIDDRRTRIIVCCGAGGVGKTRTALRAADSREGLDLKFRLSEGGSGEHDPYADVFATA